MIATTILGWFQPRAANAAFCIRGDSERFDLLSRIRHLPFPGGPIRTPMLVAAMLYYRLRDALA